jgi:hypothetical protein
MLFHHHPSEGPEGGMLVRPARTAVPHQLLIVSRSQPERYAYLQYVFDSSTGEVTLDRRVRDRRSRQETIQTERRGEERRQRDVSAELELYGWALVRYEANA